MTQESETHNQGMQVQEKFLIASLQERASILMNEVVTLKAGLYQQASQLENLIKVNAAMEKALRETEDSATITSIKESASDAPVC